MSITNPPEQKKKPLRSNGFLETHPIRFELRNDDDQPEIFVVDDDKGAPNLHLLIFNVSDAEVVLPPIDEASSQYHFELLFRPGTLATEQSVAIQQNGWKTAVLENPDGTVSVLMTFSGGLTIHGHETQTLTLQNVRANTKTGAHKSNVELRIGFLSRITIEERLSRIRVVNHRGQKQIPLHIGFIGSNTILNNGASSNTIRLRIANVLKEHEIHFNDDCHDDATKIVFSFDAQDPNSNDEMEWALGTLSQVENIEVQVKQPGWSVRVDFQGQTPEWILTCNRDLDLGPSEHIEIEFANIISSISSGFTNLHIAYENVPGYWDGRFNIPVEKSPILYRDVLGSVQLTEEKLIQDNMIRVSPTPLFENQNDAYTGLSWVGVNTNRPRTNLDVNGKVLADRGVVGHPSKGVAGGDGDRFLLAPGSKEEFPTSIGTMTGEMWFSVKEGCDFGWYAGGQERMSIRKDTLKVNSRIHDVNGPVMPRGGIIMWSGAADKVPEGWALCKGGFSGDLEIPDLRGRFIVGVGQRVGSPIDYSRIENKTGGQDFHTLTVEQLPRHNHGCSPEGSHSHEVDFDTGGGGQGEAATMAKSADGTAWAIKNFSTTTSLVGNHSHTIQATGGGQPHENRPPFYALCFIIKL